MKDSLATSLMPCRFKVLGENLCAALAIGLVGEQNGHGLGLAGFDDVIGKGLAWVSMRERRGKDRRRRR